MGAGKCGWGLGNASGAGEHWWEPGNIGGSWCTLMGAGMKVEAEECQWRPGKVGGGSGGLGLCGDDRGCEHCSKGLYDNNDSVSHSSRPEQSQAEQPRATALAPSPNEDVALGSMTLLPYPMPGGHTSQDRPPATDIVSGGPSAILAAALNDKLDRIAQRFDRLEHRQDAAKHHSDDAVQQLQLLLQWAWQRDEAE